MRTQNATQLMRRAGALSAAAMALWGASRPAEAQMVTGERMKDYASAFGVAQKSTFEAKLVSSSALGNILWPGEQPRFTFQITNLTGQALRAKGRVRLLAYGTQGIEGDIWTPQVVAKGTLSSTPFEVNFAAGGFQNLTVAPRVPSKFGGYALVVDMDGRGSQLLTSFVRTFKASSQRIQYPHFCLDNLPLPVLKRLGVQAIRLGIEYKPTTDADFPQWYADLGKKMAAYKAANIAVLFMVGAGEWFHPNQPLGRPRPWLDEKGVMQDTKTDIAWLPSYDADFEKYTRRLATDYGYPRGPINAFSLWNEPWEGISISGWGADMLRYREMYRHMASGVLAARKTGVQVLVGGADSTSNAQDKFFADESNEFVPIFDFLSIHYQGLASSANLKQWRERKGYNGRVKIWDTESWVANTDDRVAAVVATNRAAGYDRAMGVYGGNIAQDEYNKIRTAKGEQEMSLVTTWSLAASIGASQHFIGERPFKQLVFQNGLPWVMRFDGENSKSDDGTLVVVGDLSDTFGANNLLYRTARGQREIARKAQLKKQLAALPLSKKEQRQVIIDALAKNDVLSGATMTIANPKREFAAYDFYGNALSFPNGSIRVPLDGRGFFLRANGRQGAFGRLVNAVRSSSVQGIEPLATVAHDFTAPIASRPTMRLELTNVLNRAVRGALNVNINGLKLAFPQTLSFAPNETKTVDVKVVGGATRANNEYSMSLRFNGGNAGVAVHEETMRVNVVQRRQIKVDGDLREWSGAIPQIVRSSDGAPTLTEAAWFPFKKFDAKTTAGLASGYMAYDANNFYFAAKIADNTPDAGNVRFATRDDDAYFYPAVSYYKAGAGAKNFAARWSGEIEAPKSGDYTISTITDDGARLWLDDKMVIDQWKPQGATEYRTALTLKAKQRVHVRMEYFQGEGGHSARLLWQPPMEAQSAIPTASLFTADGKNGLTAEYFVGTEVTDKPLVTRIDPQVDFDWADNKSPDAKFDDTATKPFTWPEGVRRYSYRKDPDLPAGNFPKHDNVQIAFNVLPASQKKMFDKLPGVPTKFTTYADTDYEYALNAVAPQFGGGTEIWRLRSPQLPEKHYYPRQPKSRFDGPVKNGQLVMKRDGNTRIVEAAIPWSEIPDVKRRLDANLPIKFSFRVNDNESSGTMELSRGRSVAKRNGSFKVDWVEHWANELQFGWTK